MANEEIRQSSNVVEIIGTVKKVDLEEKLSKSQKEMIIGSVTVEVIDGDKVNNISVKLLSMKLTKAGAISKIYKSLQTVKEEWKVGDRARISGKLQFNQYGSKENGIIKRTQVSGQWLSRLEGEDANKPDSALATIDLTVDDISTDIDAESIPLGTDTVVGFIVGWNNTYEPIMNLKIDSELSQNFKPLYPSGSTGKITLKIQNYTELETSDIEVPAPGFGSDKQVEDIVNNYNSSLEIIGGALPYNDGINNLSPEQIKIIKNNGDLAEKSISEGVIASAVPNAFGAGSGANSIVAPINPSAKAPNAAEVMNEDNEVPF